MILFFFHFDEKLFLCSQMSENCIVNCTLDRKNRVAAPKGPNLVQLNSRVTIFENYLNPLLKKNKINILNSTEN